MRRLINQYGVWIVGAAVALSAPLLWYHLKRPQPPNDVSGDPTLAFYVDEETGEESIGAADAITPLVGKGGKLTVVEACKFDFGKPEGNKTVYLLKYAPEAQQQLATLAATDARYSYLKMNGRLIRKAAPGSPWMQENLPEGLEIENVIAAGASRVAPQRVYPKR